MSEKDWSDRVEDILDHIEEIGSFLKGKTETDFHDDAVLRRAVERSLQIIGEAANHIPDYIKEKHPSIPWQEIRGMRNVLVHGYDIVDEDVVWKTVTTRLEMLKKVLCAIRDNQKRN